MSEVHIINITVNGVSVKEINKLENIVTYIRGNLVEKIIYKHIINKSI